MKNLKSKKAIKKCQAKHPVTNESICKREIWDDTENLCIFHCKEKPVEEFKNMFLAELNRVNETNSIKEFDGQCFIFPSNTNLNGISFKKIAIFKFAQFSNRIDFSEAEFADKADFGKARFGNKAKLFRTRFGDETNFTETYFGDDTNFGLAKFGKKTNFWQAKFGEGTNFSETTFDDETYFVRTEFGYYLDFAYSRFNGEAIFQDITFGEKISDNIINFTNIIFVKPNQVRFENVNLSSFSFVKSNIQDINFLDCEWIKIRKRHVLFDEIYYSNEILNNSDILEKANLGEIEQVYLWLQANFEKNKRYPEAGDFYIGAMEMRRRQIANNKNIVRRLLRQNLFSLMALYRYISLYGERYIRTFNWMLIVLFLFSGFYLIAGFDFPTATIPGSTNYEHINYDLFHKMDISELASDFKKSFMVSLCTLTFQKNVSFHLTTTSVLISIVETVISAILVSLFLLALRRRFRR